MGSDYELPNAQVETFSEGEESNEHTATLTDTEARKEASNTAGEGVLFSGKPDLQDKRQIEKRFANESTTLNSIVTE
jgi:hypothetical protein